MRVSECCYASGTRLQGDVVTEFELLGICPLCKEHCSYTDAEKDERPDAGDREFSTAQLAQIDALQKAWDEQEAQEAADAAEWQREQEQEQEQENHPPYKHCSRCDASSYDLSAGACWNCGTEFEK